MIKIVLGIIVGLWAICVSNVSMSSTCALGKCRAATAINDCQPGELCQDGAPKKGQHCPGRCVSP